MVWKAVLEITDSQLLRMPQGAEFLCVREQMEQPCVWFRCDPAASLETRRIFIVGTGHDAPDMTYIGTAFLSGGPVRASRV